jgi:uncharacterized protein YbjT (DUF2867 family)
VSRYGGAPHIGLVVGVLQYGEFVTILVTGATGNIGRRVVDHLIGLGVRDIRALTKNPAKANLPDGVTPLTGYLGNPASLPAALEGVDRMYLAPLQSTLEATLDLVKSAGVKYVVALSGGAHWQQHTDTIAASGLVNTQLGAGEFLENFGIWSEQIIATRTVREPYPTVVEAPISMDDIARVAATLLARPDQAHYHQMYELTGPEALTRAQIAEQIGVGLGVDVSFESCSRAEAEAALRPIMGDQTGWYLDLMADGVGEPQQANQLVAELTGSPALSVAQWASRNAQLFRC